MPAATLLHGVARLDALAQEGQKAVEPAAEASLKFLGVQALHGTQAQHHPLRVPVQVRDAVVFRQHGRVVPDAPDVALQVLFVGVADAAEVRVGAGAEAGVFPQGPVFQVVAGFPARPGKVGDLILPVAVAQQIVHGVQIHIRLGLIIGEVRGVPAGIEGGALLHLQAVAAQVLRRQVHGGG